MATVRWSENLISHSDNIITDVKRVLSVSADMSPSLGPSRCMRPLTTDCSMDIRIIVFERVIASVGCYAHCGIFSKWWRLVWPNFVALNAIVGTDGNGSA
jgi:hypothetical protein